MSELSYQSIRSANQAREADELRTDSRKKNLLILVLNYLTESGYRDSAQTLSKETNIDMSKYEVCDNIDLDTILMEYESYYYVKFNRHPKITKRLTQSALPKIPQTARLPSPPARPRSGGQGQVTAPVIKPQISKKPQTTAVNGHTVYGLALQGLTVQGLQNNQNDIQLSNNSAPIIDIRAMINDATKMNAEEGVDSSDRLLKPLGGYVGYNSEWRELAQVISRDIYSNNPDVKWDDIIGLDEAKRLVKEAVVYPIKYPQLFRGILSPWKGLLLYGPPGTGKTLLAKAVATECNTTFFNISASSIVSKWRGDSEKLVRVLFELARFHAPSTIFLDELESLMSIRGSGGGGGEHEGSRRMKTELLVQMDGLAKTDDLVFLLAASNLPWELDHAMLRRLEKRILVDMPTYDARKSMINQFLPPVVNQGSDELELLADLDYGKLAGHTDGYSGSDIKLLCKEAAMRPVRKIFAALEGHNEGELLHLRLDTITTRDVMIALERTKPSAKQLKPKYEAWQKEYESV
ncbi:hypothetical protein LOTGIDRAFT_208512 [Lottia gigantea]|uniref:Katanin p60 ATPase-containing subunit A-like 2 n=1 Tax=Lottia gigantea TaxID=225164 RepID=V4BCP8_LOTGI|nr:hypothetical protein LOTGIDRAFT_208512 [Lottia gigantea]ESP05481.1 hypothetical protein LOTGIDRAFT_208512 [Lottia gigantea]